MPKLNTLFSLKRHMVICAFLLLLPTGAMGQTIQQRLDSLMQFYASEYNFNGAVIVSAGNTVLLKKAYGYQDIAAKVPNTTAATFQVGALTNAMTAMTFWHLVDDGKISPSDMVSKYYKELPGGDSIRLWDLVRNSAGILDYTIFDDYLKAHQANGVAKDSILELFIHRRPLFRSGSQMQYSASNYFLVGCIIEKICKKSFEEVVRECIFRPLHMNNSGFDFSRLESSQKASGYKYFNFVDPVKAPIAHHSLCEGAGGVYSTVEDLDTFYQYMMAQMDKNVDFFYGFDSPNNWKYVLGFYKDSLMKRMVLMHGGQMPGFSSFAILAPKEHIAIVVLQNVCYPAYDNNSIGKSIFEMMHAKGITAPKPIPEVELSEDELLKCEGDYQFAQGFTLSVSKDKGNRLRVHKIAASGVPGDSYDYQLVPIGPNMYKTKALHAKVEFRIGKDGKANALVIHQPTKDITGVRK